MKAESGSKSSQTYRPEVEPSSITTHPTAALLPITVRNFQHLCRTAVPPVLHSSEYRLLGITHDVDHRRVNLTCFGQGQIVKACLPEQHLEALKPFVGQTVKIDAHPSSVGYESVLSVQNLTLVERSQDPLLTFVPLWLDPTQQGLFAELVRLVSELDASYRDLVREVFRQGNTLEAFLDRPASLGFHHNTRGGLLAHTIEVALDCEQACRCHPTVNASLTITGALLHDIGKVFEYERRTCGPYKFGRSQTGTLEMHKTQGVAMVSIAAHLCQADPLMTSEICHLLMAVDGPQYMGLPNIKMAEAAILQSADGRSSNVNLFVTKHESKTNWDRFGGQYPRPS